ncbi:B3 domain-containing protein, partial [Trifolium pratense]
MMMKMTMLNAVEIDYDSSSYTDDDENENVGDSDDESVEILDAKDNVDHSDDESVEILDEWLNRKKTKQRSPLVSPRPHKKVTCEIKKTSQRTASSMNWPKGAKAQEVAKNFNSSNPFFTILIKPINLVENRV